MNRLSSDQVDVDYVAEIGLNHGGKLASALDHIEAAAHAGATSVKFQTYFTNERVSRDHALWDVLEACRLDVRDLVECKGFAEGLGLGFFSTAFGLESLDLLESIGVTRFKIASFGITDEQLVASAASRGQVVLSTGTATAAEIIRAAELLRAGDYEAVILHCVSSYPTDVRAAALSNIEWLRSLTGLRAGFSDHTVGFEAAAGACLLGAVMIEKHFTLSNELEGPDHAMSSNPQTFRQMVDRCALFLSMLGEPRGSRPYACEVPILPFKRFSQARDV